MRGTGRGWAGMGTAGLVSLLGASAILTGAIPGPAAAQAQAPATQQQPARAPSTNVNAVRRANDQATGSSMIRYSKRKRVGPGGQDAAAGKPAEPAAAAPAVALAAAAPPAVAKPVLPETVCHAGCGARKPDAPVAPAAVSQVIQPTLGAAAAAQKPVVPAASVAQPAAQPAAATLPAPAGVGCVAGCGSSAAASVTESRQVPTKAVAPASRKATSGEWMVRINRERDPATSP